MKFNRGRPRHRLRDSKKAAGNDDMLIKMPNDEDMLRKLPNDVLLNILERVGTLDALKTCILSKQLQKLPAMLSQIVIDPSPLDLLRMNGNVAKVTTKILSTRSPQITIRKLKVKFFLSPSRYLSIGKAVAHAMATQKIDVAEFDILTLRDYSNCTPAHFLLFAKHFIVFLGNCPDAFAGLTRLQLQNLRFGESDIPNMLSTCKRLESLSFFECDAGFRSVLHIEHARVVELVINYGEFQTVFLDCLPKLQRMTYSNWPCDENPLVLGFVPQLSKLSLANANLSGKTLNLSKLLANSLTVSDLYLEFRSEKIWVQPERSKMLTPLFSKLQFVNLDNLPKECDISWTIFLLEAAPYLEELCITVWNHKCHRESEKSYSEKIDVKWEPSDPNFKHKNLVRLIIYGFQSDDNFTGYVRRVIQAAVNISEVSLHDRVVCELCDKKLPHVELRPSSDAPTSEELDLLRKKMKPASAMSSPDIYFFS